jgi:hypothetical protein
MECVCGCGRDVPRKQVQRNFTAATIAVELLAWDKNRASPIPGPDGREGLIARGADCYERVLYAIHEEGGGDPDEDCREWLEESAQMRLQRPDMNKKSFLTFGRRTGTPIISDADMEHLDRKHPELSFTAQLEAAAATATVAPSPSAESAPDPATPDDDLVGKLERLRALRDDGTLSEEEFAAAKARLLG